MAAYNRERFRGFLSTGFTCDMCVPANHRVAPMTIPELAVLQDQTYSERRRCGRRPSEDTAAKNF